MRPENSYAEIEFTQSELEFALRSLQRARLWQTTCMCNQSCKRQPRVGLEIKATTRDLTSDVPLSLALSLSFSFSHVRPPPPLSLSSSLSRNLALGI